MVVLGFGVVRLLRRVEIFVEVEIVRDIVSFWSSFLVGEGVC